ncbi:MAG: TetR/AcrR family transcriptional regulator [Lachnospiraceae bacterium]|nr:TetR/AcrR family transcriptional regulator [Lachnospiraceae bacterium]
MVKKGSKPPEVRRKELIEVAGRLFAERGYESVAVRDILAEVKGAPGMFYYYFKSKQEIYLAVMEEYINEKLKKKCELLVGEDMSFEERRDMLAELIARDIKGYADRFSQTCEDTISDASYKMYDLIQMVSKLIKPYAVFMLQGIREGKIENRLGITEENAEETAAFVLYGLWGVIYNDRFTQVKIHTDSDSMSKMIKRLFYE